MATEVRYTCSKEPCASCPLCQLNNDGTPRCAGCINQQIEFVKKEEAWKNLQPNGKCATSG